MRLASENELGARDAFRAALGAAENGRSATRAASGLIHLGGATTSDLPNLARILARGGDATGALAAYDRYMAEIDSAPPVEIRLARARLLAGSSRLSEAARELSELAESMDPAVGAPSLRELVRVQRRLGQGGSARATQDRLVARFPESAEAVDIGGWEARREGHPWTGRLARVIYPFPYRDLIVEEAREREVDPFLMAGLIRQESAFKADIVSSAGAVGLMQVMPATGRELARAVGPRGFREELLSTAEVNLHLGSRFLVDMLHRYDGRLTLVLSAYNAGPSRANRWRQLPEASDPARFTERIPFAETRGYVKNVTRNVQVYRWLYGVEE